MKIEEFILQAKENKCRPAIYISNSLFNIEKNQQYFKDILKECEKHRFIIILDKNKEEICRRYKKLYLARYGIMGTYLETLIVRRGGKIISGCLDI